MAKSANDYAVSSFYEFEGEGAIESFRALGNALRNACPNVVFYRDGDSNLAISLGYDDLMKCAEEELLRVQCGVNLQRTLEPGSGILLLSVDHDPSFAAELLRGGVSAESQLTAEANNTESLSADSLRIMDRDGGVFDFVAGTPHADASASTPLRPTSIKRKLPEGSGNLKSREEWFQARSGRGPNK